MAQDRLYNFFKNPGTIIFFSWLEKNNIIRKLGWIFHGFILYVCPCRLCHTVQYTLKESNDAWSFINTYNNNKNQYTRMIQHDPIHHISPISDPGNNKYKLHAPLHLRSNKAFFDPTSLRNKQKNSTQALFIQLGRVLRYKRRKKALNGGCKANSSFFFTSTRSPE